MIKGNVSGIEKDITKVMMQTPNGHKEGWEVRDASDRLIWGRQGTISSVPPISFRGGAGYLENYHFFGNTVQNGTPTPDAPVSVDGCGDRTENLFNGTLVVGYYSNDINTLVPAEYYRSFRVQGLSNGQYTVSWSKPVLLVNAYYNGVLHENIGVELTSYTVTSSDGDIAFSFRDIPYGTPWSDTTTIMLNTGSTAKPFEPYGYKIPVSCSGVTTPIYLGQVQTLRRIKKIVLTGQEIGWSDESSGSNRFFQITLSNAGITANGVCTHFVYKTISVSNTDAGFSITGAGTNLRIRPDSISSVSLSGFKQWLATQYTEGTPVTVWYVLAEPKTGIVNEPLMKIGDYADVLDSTSTGIMIPTLRGSNTLSVETTVQPSNVSITGHIKPTT